MFPSTETTNGLFLLAPNWLERNRFELELQIFL